MTSRLTTRGFMLLIMIFALSSCASQYPSREEAEKATKEWIKQGGWVTVLTPPSPNELKAQWRRERIAENNRCTFAKQEIENLERTVPPDNFEETEIQEKYTSLIVTKDDACSDRKIIIKEIDLTERQESTKRECKDDQQSKRFICKERDIPTNEISKKDWDTWPKADHHFIYR